MAEPQVTAHGSWTSPITSDLIVSETIDFGQIALDGEEVYWTEMRPGEGGRNVIVKRTPDGRMFDVTPDGFNVRTRVHEYGGGAFAVDGGAVVFSNFADGRLYRQDPGTEPRPITPEAEMRYADGVIDRRRRRVICVREDHTGTRGEPVNALVAVDLEGRQDIRELVSGHDFYSSPHLSPDGKRLAWLAWDHPNMPWDGTELWVADIEPDGSLGPAEHLAGGADESIFEPRWSPDGRLYFVSDRTGWWNLHRWHSGRAEPLCSMEAEFGMPQWVFGMSTYAFESADRIICTFTQGGTWRLASLDTTSGELDAIETPYTDFSFLQAAPERALFFAASPTEPASIVQLDMAAHEYEVLRRSSEITLDFGYVSVPRAIAFPTEGGLTAHAFFYAPNNCDHAPPAGERPPLLVVSHGGPTSATSDALDLRIQYWTSRGFAVCDVNYGGSTGYGRAYRERLDGRWGLVDVDDCMNAARHLVERGEVDGDRLAIRGSSAGGYATLCALTFGDVFAAGASYCGISDLEAMTKDTHKFESRYLDRLVGSYPERRDLYVERSPIHFTDRLSCPVILFQGLDDKVVPPDQAELMVEALRAKGLPVAYVPFEGEGHGFRRAENIKRALDAELYFYSRVFGFDLAEPVAPVVIEGL